MTKEDYDIEVAKEYTTLQERIATLEKENAELKEKLNIRSCQNCKHNNKSCPNDGSCKHYSKWEGYENPQLTKAKHYIKELARAVEHSYSVLSWQRPPIKAEAEQFLNSEVEK